jgi:peptidyl-prolyl cis-trans isomerase D
MIGTLRKHQQWLWILIITVVIITFVIWFSPDAQWAGTKRARASDYVPQGTSRPVTINGKPISREEYARAYQETRLAYFMRTGGREWPDNDENTLRSLERDAIYRVFLLHRIQDLDIHVSNLAVARAARDRLGNYPLEKFEADFLLPNGVRVEDFERFMHNEVAIQQLLNTAAVSAKLFSPKEAETLYRKEHEQTFAELAVFWASNHLAEVKPTDEDLGKFYTNRMSFYRIPDRVVMSYVDFPATNFFAEADKQIAEITNFNARVDDEYLKRGTNAFTNAVTGAVLSEAEAKAHIKEEVRKSLGLLEAHRKANAFGDELMNQPNPNDATNLHKLAAAKGLVVKATPPFDRMGGLEGQHFPDGFVERALQLKEDQPIAFQPIRGEEAVYVIALQRREPSRQRPYEEVKDKVREDFTQNKALELARSAGTNFHAALTNGLAQKKTFDQIVAETKVEVLKLPPFTPSMTTLTNLDERIPLRVLQQQAQDLKPGQAGGYLPTPFGKVQGGFVMYLRERRPVDEARLKAELPEFLARLRSYRQNEAFNQWFRKQVEQHKLVIPQPQSAVGSAS